MPSISAHRRRADGVHRNVISWLMDRETLMFGYSPAADMTSSAVAAPEVASPWTDSSELEDDNDIARFENEIVDQPESRLAHRPEVREARLLAGFHNIDLQHKEQVTVSTIPHTVSPSIH